MSCLHQQLRTGQRVLMVMVLVVMVMIMAVFLLVMRMHSLLLLGPIGCLPWLRSLLFLVAACLLSTSGGLRRSSHYCCPCEGHAPAADVCPSGASDPQAQGACAVSRALGVTGPI